MLQHKYHVAWAFFLFLLNYSISSSSMYPKKSSSVPTYTSKIPLKTLVVKENKWLRALYLEHTFLLRLFLLPQHFW